MSMSDGLGPVLKVEINSTVDFMHKMYAFLCPKISEFNKRNNYFQ